MKVSRGEQWDMIISIGDEYVMMVTQRENGQTYNNLERLLLLSVGNQRVFELVIIDLVSLGLMGGKEGERR